MSFYLVEKVSSSLTEHVNGLWIYSVESGIKVSFKPKMKIFEIVQKQYAVLGISSSQQSTETYPISKKVFLGLLLFGYTTVSEFVYTFYMSRDFMEYVECICSLSGNIIIFICFAAVVIRERAIFEMIGNIEKFIDTSKPHFYVFI